jgi:YidC/Oxa1 family membrane protein insertase
VAILNPLNDAVAWVIMRIHAALGAIFGPDTGLAWGLSIVILVMFIRLLLVPLFVKQVHAQRKMAQHAPQLQELRKKYKNDKQRLNEETMKFYKENGVNPLAGCLPLIPQMIVFFSLFSVLRFIADWKPGHALSYGFTESVVQSAQQATIFGVHLGDKLLFAHPAPPLHVAIVIALTVVVSATTTFMTVRQSAKRGLMQTNMDPDNPMAQSQKFMQYIVPFFSLTGLYWQYGLVLYWVTTNLWTLGQQFFMFRNWAVESAQSAGATASAAQSPARPAASGPAAKPPSGTAAKSAARTAKPGGSGSRPAAGGGAKAASATAAKPASGTAAKPASAAARSGAGNGRTASAAPQVKADAGTGGSGAASNRARTGSAASDAAAASSTGNGQNSAGMRGLLRFGRPKQDPAPEPEVPATKVVRQQPVRQARSKRSGKR